MSATEKPAPTAAFEHALPQWWVSSADRAGEMISLPWKTLWDASLASQKVYSEAMNRELDLLRSTQERLGKTCQELVGCRKPQDVLALQSALLSDMYEAASAQAKVTAETVEQLRVCMSSAAKDAIEARKV